MAVDPSAAGRGRATDPVEMAWFVTSRWTTLAAASGAVLAGWRSTELQLSGVDIAAAAMAFGLSNLWLWWRVRKGRATSLTLAGAFVCGDVLLLSWLLLDAGGVLNPASVFYLVQIVLAALVLGRAWTWIVTALSVAGYAALFLTPTDALRAAQSMHPEIAMHMRGMWIAFALTALIIAALVTRLTIAVERRDRTLAELRDRTARSARIAGLTTVVAGAAHELSTPLATMAVAAHELERAIRQRGGDAGLADDARLIRVEVDRCRAILNHMAGRVAEPMGEVPRAGTVAETIAAALGRFSAQERGRVAPADGADIPIVWPAGVVAQAIGNLVRNALQASDGGGVRIDAVTLPDGRVRLTVADRGRGMNADELARAGEPFFTTKPAGSGTGLGVFVTRSAVEQLGGELTLASVPGSGTSATVTLPQSVVRVETAS